jgi:hypothetical protein
MGGHMPLLLAPKGLPTIQHIHIWPQNARGIATVSISLERDTRANLAKWAKHLGVEIVEGEPYETFPGNGQWMRRLEAVHVADGIETKVWISFPAEAPAEQAPESVGNPAVDQ